MLNAKDGEVEREESDWDDPSAAKYMRRTQTNLWRTCATGSLHSKFVRAFAGVKDDGDYKDFTKEGFRRAQRRGDTVEETWLKVRGEELFNALTMQVCARHRVAFDAHFKRLH